jgi:hypothetical protein
MIARSSVEPTPGIISSMASIGQIKYPKAPMIVVLAHNGVEGSLNANHERSMVSAPALLFVSGTSPFEADDIVVQLA